MKLYVTRHGETDYNAQGRYAGSSDVPLNATGISQARELSLKLKGMSFDVIISSPLIRARQTAEIVCAALERDFQTADWLAERCVGVYEGLTREEAMQKYPDLWARKCTSQIDDAPTNGETLRDVDKRVTEGLEHLRHEYIDKHVPDKHVLLICHGFISRAINRYCMGLSFDDMHTFTMNNCEIAKYDL